MTVKPIVWEETNPLNIIAKENKRLEAIIRQKDEEITYYRTKFNDLITMPSTDEDFIGIVVRKDYDDDFNEIWKYVGCACEKCGWKVG